MLCFLGILRTGLCRKEDIEESAHSGCRITSMDCEDATTCAGLYVSVYVYICRSRRNGEEGPATNRNHVEL